MAPRKSHRTGVSAHDGAVAEPAAPPDRDVRDDLGTIGSGVR